MQTYKENVTVEEAVQRMLETCAHIEDTQTVSLSAALGYVLAEDMVAAFDNPPFDRAPVDGYACDANLLAGASKETPVKLRVITEIDAGDWFGGTVGRGEAARIMTGAPIPAGCNCCIRQEDTDYGEETVSVYKALKPWDNYCYAGEDFKKGTCLLKKGTKLGYVELAVLAGMGQGSVPVYRKPRIVLMTSGDEVLTPGEVLRPGKIYNSNLTMLEARLRELGYPAEKSDSVKDDPAEMAARLQEAAEYADIIITTGGVSVGKKDIMHEALRQLGAQRVYWHVKMKPGMPTLYSTYHNVPIVSLSGNPFGVAVTAEMLIRPMLAYIAGDQSLALQYTQGILQDSFGKQIKGRRFIRAVHANGNVTLPNGLHSNGVIASMAGCNCLIDTGNEQPDLVPGCPVRAVLL